MATPTPPPVAVETAHVDAGLTPLTSRVSRPMPAAKERKPPTDPQLELASERAAAAAGGELGGTADSTERGPSRDAPGGGEP
jgi:hypothetical protein